MNDEDRDTLCANYSVLVPAIDWRKIWPKLLEHEIFGLDHVIVPKWEKSLDKFTTQRDIYWKIQTRGPHAFRNFVKCLIEIGQSDLANILNNGNDCIDKGDNGHNLIPSINQNNNVHSENEDIEDKAYEVDKYWKKLDRIREPLTVRVQKSDKFMDIPSKPDMLCYTMRSNPRGLVLIINNIEFGETVKDRKAAEHDGNNLKTLFEQIGYEVKIHLNLTGKEMYETIEDFSKLPKLRFVHSIFVIVMSHGKESNVGSSTQSLVYGIDNEYIKDMEIFSYFTASACPHMARKPKIFIFQTCRGEEVQRVASVPNVNTGRQEEDISLFMPAESSSQPSSVPRTTVDYSDMLVAYSTLPGYKAHRDIHNGSWYIQVLCEAFMNNAKEKELLELFQMTDERLKAIQTETGACQTSTVTSYGFNKKCYLSPGFFGTGTDT